MKKIVSIILGATMLLSSVAANAAITYDDLKVTTTQYKTYTDSEGATHNIATGTVNDLAMKGDWTYIANRATSGEAGGEGYVTAYNSKTGEFFTLETKATVSEGITVSNTNTSDSGTIYNYHPKSLKIRGDYLFVGYGCQVGTTAVHQTKGGIRVYDISNPAAPIDVTGNNYTGTPTKGGRGVEVFVPITDALAVNNVTDGKNPGSGRVLRIEDISDPLNITQLYEDTTPNGAITNVIYDEESKLLYATAKTTALHVYDLSDPSKIVKVGVADITTANGFSANASFGWDQLAKTEDGFVNVYATGAMIFDVTVDKENSTVAAKEKKTISWSMRSELNTLSSALINGDYVILTGGQGKNCSINYYDLNNVPALDTANKVYGSFYSGWTGSVNGAYVQNLTAEDNIVRGYQKGVGLYEVKFGNDLIVPSVDGISYKSGGTDLPSIASGNISVTTEISNITFEDKEPYVVTALYNDATLEMEAIEYAPVPVKAGKTVSYPQTITVPAGGDYHIETFVFYDLDEILPVETGTQGILE